MNKSTIDDISLKGKRVLVRVDFNVPVDDQQRITDDTRIVESLPTIRKILNDGGKAILMSHLGRPKGKPKKEFSLKPVAEHLSKLLGKPVKFSPDCVGVGPAAMVKGLADGDCLLLENLRFHPEEEANDGAFAKKLASLGDVYINDAFGSAHRAHASTEGVTKYITSCVAGYLMRKELEYLGRTLTEPARPFVAIMGGAKISGKIDVIQNLLGKVDALLIGGGMMFTFFKAQGLEIGKSLLEADKIDLARSILEQAKANNVRILLPSDCVIADKFENAASTETVNSRAIPPDCMGMDIGPETMKYFAVEIMNAKTVIWNGPMGVFEMEKFSSGTTAIARVLAEATASGATTIVGGGDSAAAITQAGLEDSVSHVSTGGGASLELLEGKILPGVAALNDKK